VNGSYIAVDEWSSDDLLADEKLVCEWKISSGALKITYSELIV
jgi:hypothetical protein